MTRLLSPKPLCWLALGFCLSPALGSNVEDAKNQAASVALFSNNQVLELRLEIPAPGIESLKKENRKFVRATIKEGEHIYRAVGVHLKGVGSFRPIGEKPSLTLKFNEFTSGQRFHGLTRIMLNNSVQDPTYINEPLCGALFREMGVPTVRATHARVWLNERYLGLYVLVEGLSKDFLKLNFRNTDGALYEAYVQDVDEELKQDNGENRSKAGLQALLEATRVADADARWKQLQSALDLDRFISMLAGEILMAHWDGYWMNHNNYRIYHDTAHKRMVLIPHGLDSMFQQPAMSWQPKQQTLLVQAVLQTSEGQRRYREHFTGLLKGPFKTETLQQRVDTLASRLRPVLAQDNARTAKEWEKEVGLLREHIAERIKHLTEELAAANP